MSKLWRIAVVSILFFCFQINISHADKWVRAKSLDKIPGVKQIMTKKKLMNNETMELDYSIPEPVIEDCDSSGLYPQNTKEISLGNAPNRKEEGRPVLPFIPVKLIIPAGYDLDSIKVKPGKKITLQGKHAVKHGLKPVPITRGIKIEPTLQDKAVYETDHPYPNTLYERVSVQRKRGVAILFVNLNPMEYRPLSGTLSYYETMTVSVQTKPATSKKSKIRFRPEKEGNTQTSVENPEMIVAYANGEESSLPLISDLIVDPDDSFSYVIITSQAIIDDTSTTPYSMNDFIEHKQSLGFTVTAVVKEIIFSEDGGAGYPGVDNPEKLRNFITDAYNHWGTEYVLLGGDSEIIPARYLTAVDWFYVPTPSDLYYQCLDGNYNYDGDQYWGEPTDGDNNGNVDMFAEVYIGRVAADDAVQMSNFIFKTIAYENDAGGEPYLKNALIISECMCGDIEYEETIYETYECSCNNPAWPRYLFHVWNDEIRYGSSNDGYTTLGFSVVPEITIETLYDSDYDPYLWESDDPDTLTDKLNSGNYSIINHIGHSQTDKIMRLRNPDVDALSNSKYFFIYSQGCWPGNFTEDAPPDGFDTVMPDHCIAEHLTTHHRTGAFAGVFNSRPAPLVSSPASQSFNRQFWDAYFGESISGLGALNADSHEDVWKIGDQNIPTICYYETNLFGDPALCLKIPRCDYTLRDLTLYGADSLGEEYRYTSECSITAGPNFKIETGAEATFQAAEEIVLDPEFEAAEGCEFVAEIQ